MKAPTPAQVQEPVGIVISHNAAAERPTVFSAYVWGPAPEDVPAKTA